MDTILTEEELTNTLLDLKQALSIFKAPELHNITFINLNSLLRHADVSAGTSAAPHDNLTALLERISPYIPLAITGKNIEAFMAAALQNDEQELRKLESAFVHDSKIKFINSAFTARTAAEWDEIFSICRTIRLYKEENYPQPASVIIQSH